MTIVSHGLVTLKCARSDGSLTVAALAQLAGVSQSTIYQIENEGAGHSVSYEAANALAKALGRSREEIDWPFGLTIQGAEHVGARYSTRSNTVDENSRSNLCGSCFTKLPQTGECAYCAP